MHINMHGAQLLYSTEKYHFPGNWETVFDIKRVSTFKASLLMEIKHRKQSWQDQEQYMTTAQSQAQALRQIPTSAY